MPASRTRKPAAKKPPAAKGVADNNLAAEALVDLAIPFMWRDVAFLIDLPAMQFGRATYALRTVGDESVTLVERVHAMIDVFEAALGQDQVKRLVGLAPNIFDDTDTLMSFWDTFNKACYGATSGESSAS